MNDEDFLTFIDETPAGDTSGQPSPDDDASSNGHSDPWRVLVVDDDQDVHETTAYALRGLEIAGRSLQLLHAYSGSEAVALLRSEPGVAVILLDVVMETGDAGLVTVETIRGELGMHNTRIILRTGQPGQAPEIETIRRYDINDYKTKSELTRPKLYTSLTTAIRSFDQLRRLDASRRGLEQIVSASNQFIAETGLQSFAEGVITQIASLIGIDPAGLLCACVDQPHPGDATDQPQYLVIAAAGRFRHLIQQRITEISDQRIVESLSQCLRERHNRIARHSVTLFFGGHDGCDFAAFVDSALPLQEVDQHLLGVFCTNIALCAANVKLVARLREQAFVDRLLGLPNRTAFIRHLDQSIEAQAMAGRAIALIDVDCFAETNDMFGHPYGDLLLAAIAARLVSALPDDCLVARVAGDTFGVFGTAALVCPEALNPLFDEHFVIDGVQRAVSVCMGFVRCDGAAENGLELIKDASIAIKRAKAAGQGRCEYYSQSIGDETRERTRLCTDCSRPSTVTIYLSITSHRWHCKPGGWSGSRPCCAGVATTVVSCLRRISYRWPSIPV